MTWLVLGLTDRGRFMDRLGWDRLFARFNLS